MSAHVSDRISGLRHSKLPEKKPVRASFLKPLFSGFLPEKFAPTARNSADKHFFYFFSVHSMYCALFLKRMSCLHLFLG
jgi:hypothetical protein